MNQRLLLHIQNANTGEDVTKISEAQSRTSDQIVRMLVLQVLLENDIWVFSVRVTGVGQQSNLLHDLREGKVTAKTVEVSVSGFFTLTSFLLLVPWAS